MEHHNHSHDHSSAPHIPGLGVYAAEIDISPVRPMAENDCLQVMSAFIAGLAHRAVAAGGRVIGHIKGVLQVADGGHLYASVTSDREPVRCSGEILGLHAQLNLAVNALVFGVESDTLRQAVCDTMKNLADSFGFRFELLAHGQQSAIGHVRGTGVKGQGSGADADHVANDC